ncbi:MAG: hypothetical protein ACO38W_05395, partial [Phycisphaerales bacterium]
DGMDVKVMENADDCVHITLPAAPAGHMDLSDDEPSNAAGGSADAAAGCYVCTTSSNGERTASQHQRSRRRGRAALRPRPRRRC